MFDFMIHGFDVALTPLNLALALIGATLGTFFGALPGIGPINGIANLMPQSISMTTIQTKVSGVPPDS